MQIPNAELLALRRARSRQPHTATTSRPTSRRTQRANWHPRCGQGNEPRTHERTQPRRTQQPRRGSARFGPTMRRVRWHRLCELRPPHTGTWFEQRERPRPQKNHSDRRPSPAPRPHLSDQRRERPPVPGPGRSRS